MFNFFAPKEVSLFRKGLDLLEHRVGTSPSFEQVRQFIDTDIKKSAQPYIAAIRNSNSPEQVAATSVSNVAGDIIESGNLCLYRGILTPAGEEMFQLYIKCMDYLVESGFIDAGRRNEEIAAIRRNLKTLG